MAEKFCIWWTSSDDAKRVAKLASGNKWPHYLRVEFGSRYGRAGRGRLWLNDELKEEGAPSDVPFVAGSKVADMASEAGGIIIRVEDLCHVAALPGFVTTIYMRVLKIVSIGGIQLQISLTQ